MPWDTSEELESLASQVIAADVPKQVISAAGKLLAFRLRPEGFDWKSSRRSLDRKYDEGRLERIVLEADRWNKRDVLIVAKIAVLMVLDERLGAWRVKNEAVTVPRPGDLLGIVCAVSFFDFASPGSDIVLTVPRQRIIAIERAVDDLRELALPWFTSTRNLAELPDRVPDSLLHPAGFAHDLLELLVSRDELDVAQRLIRRVLDRGPESASAFEEGRILARSGERPRWHSPIAFGWSCEILGLTAPRS